MNFIKICRLLGASFLLVVNLFVTVCDASANQQVVQTQGPDILLPFYQTDTIGTELWGYINQNGQEKIKLAYVLAEPFDAQGTAIVGIGDGDDLKYGLIDSTGAYILQPEYSYLKEWSADLFYAQKAEETKLLTRKGETLAQSDSFIEEPSEDLAVYQQNGLFGYLDSKGHVRLQPQYVAASAFAEGKAVVASADQKYVLIDKTGKVLRTIPYTPDQVTIQEFHDGLANYYDKTSNLSGYLDESGKVAIPAKYTEANSFIDGLAVVQTANEGNRTGLINTQGKLVVPAEYTVIFSLHNGLWAVGKGDESLGYPAGGPQRYAIVNKQGQFVTDFQYDSLEPFEGEYAVAQAGTSTFFIDQQGKKVENLPTFAGIGTASIQGDIITATIDEKLQYLRRNGSIIWQEPVSQTIAPGVTITQAKLRPHRNYLAYYPVLKGLQDQVVQEKINNLLKHQVTSTEADFQSEDYSADFSVEMIQKDLLVIRTSSYSYPFGAAHGMPGLEYKHINLRTGQLFTLKDLFLPGSSYMKKLNELVSEQVKTKGEVLGVFPEVMEKFDGFTAEDQFYVSGQNLHIYFNPYEIGPYAAGFITFTIPLDSLKDILDTKGDFWQSIDAHQ